jgi:hexosaminidase
MSSVQKTRIRLSQILRQLILLFLVACQSSVSAQTEPYISIIPVPVSMQVNQGSFELNNNTSIGIPMKPADASTIAAYLADRIKPATGFNLRITTSGEASIQFLIKSPQDTKLGKEGYNLTVKENKIIIQANTSAGLFYGVQTLLQLLPGEIESKSVAKASWKIPAVTITDYPRFAWRGLMLDVSRNFFPKEYIKAYIDQMARYKLNRFHWHLTDDNGWRVEIKSLPKLTEVGAWRVPRTGTFGDHKPPQPGEAATAGGFYTHQDIKEIVQYARQRYIEILPEIDVPGHSMAAIAAYPELSVTKDTSTRVNPGSKFSTWFGDGKFEMHIDNTLNPTDEKVYAFLDKVFGEVASLFPFEYVHMGGDECYKGFWERDPGVQAFMKKNSIKDGEALQSYLTKRVTKILAAKKKKLIGWDEILEGGLAPGAAVMSWRGVKGGIEAAHQKHFVVMSPAPLYYLDMMQGDPAVEPPVYGTARLKDVYAFDILPKEIDSTYVLGGQGNLWTEQIPTTVQVEYMTYPRAFAIAESMWSPKAKKNWPNFVTRVENHFGRFDLARINYATSLYDPIMKVKKGDQGITVELTTEVDGLTIHYTLDNTIPNQYSPVYKDAILLPGDVDALRIITYRNDAPAGRLISIRMEELVKRIRK